MSFEIKKIGESEYVITCNGEIAAWCSKFRTRSAARHVLNKMIDCVHANEAWIS